jgi:hypothetical protein
MPIVPDTKDWTWVLARPCPDCGFDAADVSAGDVAGLARGQAGTWSAIVRMDDGVRARPADDRWSVLEYACHVRDVFRLAERRVTLMVTDHDPVFANWDQDATAIEERYNEQDPITVAIEIRSAASSFADLLDGLHADAWRRPGRRSDGACFTVESFTRYVIHDPIHHVVDVNR